MSFTFPKENEQRSHLPRRLASVLQEKVINELRDEIHLLKQRVYDSRMVSITGPMGIPIYAEAPFDQGDHAPNENCWRVAFPKNDAATSCPLRGLESIQVRIGGVCKGLFDVTEGMYEGFLDPDRNYEAIHNGVATLSFYVSQSAGLWLTVVAGTFPDEDALKYAASAPTTGIIPELCGLANTEHVTVSFEEVQFEIRLINGLVETPHLCGGIESDIAPFILAYIENQQLSDLLREARLFRAKERQSRTVAITGPNGAPVYMESFLESGNYAADPSMWEINFMDAYRSMRRHHHQKGVRLAFCSVKDLDTIQIRLNGFCKALFTDNASRAISTSFDGVRSDGRSQINFGGTMKVQLRIRYGEFIDEEEFWQLYEANYNPERTAQRLVKLRHDDTVTGILFEKVLFVADYVNGAIEHLQKEKKSLVGEAVG